MKLNAIEREAIQKALTREADNLFNTFCTCKAKKEVKKHILLCCDLFEKIDNDKREKYIIDCFFQSLSYERAYIKELKKEVLKW